jgi:hypothetical protein
VTPPSPRPWSRFLLAWLAGCALSGLAGAVLPWRLDDRLRCRVAYDATVASPEDEARVVPGAVGATSALAGIDPWGRPFRLVQRPAGRTGVLRYAVSAGPDGAFAPIGVASDDVVVPGVDDQVVQTARLLPPFLLLVVTQLVGCAWLVWRFSPRWPVPVVLVATGAVAATGVASAGLLEHGFDLPPPATLVLGSQAVLASSGFAGLLGALFVLLARRHHDRQAV